MQRKVSGRLTRKLILTASLAALGTATEAHAWVERTVSTRVTTPAGSGCIQIQSGVSHGDANSKIAISALAYTQGFTGTNGALNCNNDAPGAVKEIAGQLDIYLIKLVTDSTTRDFYTYCRIESSGPQSFNSALRFDVGYPNAPCGAGYYAVVACLQRATTRITPAGGGAAKSGWFDAAPYDCNYSSNYHPVGVGNNVTPGPAVNL